MATDRPVNEPTPMILVVESMAGAKDGGAFIVGHHIGQDDLSGVPLAPGTRVRLRLDAESWKRVTDNADWFRGREPR